MFNDKDHDPNVDELILVQCGRHLEYVTVNDKLKIPKGGKFKSSHIHFDHNIIICKMLATEKPHLVQIVGKNPH